MRPDSGLDSPLSSTRSSPQYYYSQTNLKRQSYPPAGLPAYNSPTENHSPACYYSPQQQHAPPPYERQIQTPPMATPMSVAPPSASNPWQHHHHSSPNSQAAFPQSQDRYICPTCSKAFSRPSSLRIHSHSHTGEKPFKCPHHGCGKAFSVRSNMKRHERGCHQWDINRFINRFCIIWYKSKRSKCTLIICIKSSLFLVFISFAFILLGFSSLFADCISEIWHFSGSKRLFDFGDLSYHTTTASAYYIYTMTFLGIHILVLNVWFLQDIFPHFPCLCIACIFFFGKCGRSGHGKRLPLFLFFMLSPTPPPLVASTRVLGISGWLSSNFLLDTT